MKMEISARDKKLLAVACSALIMVVMIRLAILPAMDAYEAGKLAYEEKCAQAEEMQMRMDDRPVNETRIEEGLDRLDELSDSCYEIMENRQVDELVTGVALAHDLFPSRLSISGQTEGIRMPYPYHTGMPVTAAGTESGEDADVSSGDEETRITENPEEPAEDSGETQAAEISGAAEGGAVRKAEASITLSGTESNMRAFLDDIEENYPAIHVKTFGMSESLYLNTELQAVTEIQMSAVLEIYMYSRPEGR